MSGQPPCTEVQQIRKKITEKAVEAVEKIAEQTAEQSAEQTAEKTAEKTSDALTLDPPPAGRGQRLGIGMDLFMIPD
ncbi:MULTISPECIES: hypothetical protein [unclassified Streptomyces]|uniref:hypothetical protein n=1 Tax=unclassified Streptomyces TaxID=2593676 RepID=UPI00225979FA|nr:MULTISPECIES: hypothetical protein [unclassified Streptomyces]MCX5053289.1 hypothetical protein [Streptomyces sp. NBC_00474]